MDAGINLDGTLQWPDGELLPVAREGLNVPEGRHYTFTDAQAFVPQLDAKLDIPDDIRIAAIGTVHPTRIVVSQRAYITAFFDQHLRHRPQRLLDGPSPRHPDIRFIR